MRSVWLRSFVTFIVAAVLTCLPITSTVVHSDAATPTAPTSVGVYRWDAWHGGTDSIYQAAKATLQPSQYRNKVPFYGQTNLDGSVDINDTNQSAMDREISYAHNGGVNYWIFLHYSDYAQPEATMNQSLRTYLASTNKSQIQFAYMLSHELYDSLSQYWPQSRADMINQMKDGQYQTVLNGRPIVYIYSDAAGPNLASRLVQLRSAAQAAGLPNPYIVTIDLNPSTFGADAATSWTPSGGSGDTWSNYASSVSSENATLTSTYSKTVLTAHVNWDSRPYHDNPPPWWTSPPNTWYQPASSDQYRQLVQSAVDQTQAQPSQNEANTVFVYAWNEFAEGGIMCPTVNSDGSINTTVLDGLAQVNKLGSGSQSGVSNDLAAGRSTYLASSSWDSTQGASKAFDGSLNTDWQAAPGSSYSNQWLEVDFGTTVTASGATLSEYGNRTSGYELQYWTGTAWQTAYTGTTIGPNANLAFPAVTTSKMRLAFTAGSSTPVIYNFAVTGPSQDLATGRANYTSSSNWDSSQTAAQAFDGSPATNWQAASGTGFPGQWVQSDFGAPLSIHQATLSEYGNRTSGYQIQYMQNGSWQTAYTGTSIGASTTVSFPFINAQVWRIYFTQGSDTPIIFEASLQ